MFNHKGIVIKINEGREFEGDAYRVATKSGAIYHTECQYGDCFAKAPQAALDLAKELIDRHR